MQRVYIRFYAELNDFLAQEHRYTTFEHLFEGRRPVKDLLASLGVPHTEVDLILANGRSVDFTYVVQDSDHISVYPVFESIDISPVVRLRPKPLREPRFVLDVHLGRLARYLRMMGFDTLYRNDYTDDQLAHISRNDHRILLTRDAGLLKRVLVTHGYWVRETAPRGQLVEVLRRFHLLGAVAPFQRCLTCNELLQPVEKQSVQDRLPPRAGQCYDEFRLCPNCAKVYWKGSHYDRMRSFIEAVCQEAGA